MTNTSSSVTISTSRELKERIRRAHALLVANGLASLPDGAVPDDRTTIGPMTAVEVGLGLLEMHFAASTRKGKR